MDASRYSLLLQAPSSWASPAEWRAVRGLLFAPAATARWEGVRRVAAWRSRAARHTLPAGAESTAAFVEVMLRDPHAVRERGGGQEEEEDDDDDDDDDDDEEEEEEEEEEELPAESGDCWDAASPGRSEMELRLLYSMALIRFVNGTVDPAQKGEYAAPIISLAQTLGLPAHLVELRHEAAHGALPILVVLRAAARESLAWLRVHYWGIPAPSADAEAETDTLDACIRDVRRAAFPDFARVACVLADAPPERAASAVAAVLLRARSHPRGARRAQKCRRGAPDSFSASAPIAVETIGDSPAAARFSALFAHIAALGGPGAFSPFAGFLASLLAEDALQCGTRASGASGALDGALPLFWVRALFAAFGRTADPAAVLRLALRRAHASCAAELAAAAGDALGIGPAHPVFDAARTIARVNTARDALIRHRRRLIRSRDHCEGREQQQKQGEFLDHDAADEGVRVQFGANNGRPLVSLEEARTILAAGNLVARQESNAGAAAEVLPLSEAEMDAAAAAFPNDLPFGLLPDGTFPDLSALPEEVGLRLLRAPHAGFPTEEEERGRGAGAAAAHEDAAAEPPLPPTPEIRLLFALDETP